MDQKAPNFLKNDSHHTEKFEMILELKAFVKNNFKNKRFQSLYFWGLATPVAQPNIHLTLGFIIWLGHIYFWIEVLFIKFSF